MNHFPDAADEDEKADEASTDDDQASRFLPSEHRETAAPRRAEEERRQSEEVHQEEERRVDENRRQAFDRRNMGLEVTCKTTGSISNLEDWLEDNCKSDCQVVLEKIGRELDIKHIKVMFETEVDRDTFLDRYLKVDE